MALSTMRGAGFGKVEAKIVYHTHTFSSVGNFIDSWFYIGEDDPEFLEMGAGDKVAMSRELQSAFQAFRSDGGFVDEFETIYITGFK